MILLTGYLNLNAKNEMSVSLIEKEREDILSRFDKINDQASSINHQPAE